MIRLIAVLAILALIEPPRLYVVAARDEVMPGQVFTVTVLSFGEVGPVEFDPGSFTVLTDTLGLPSRRVWLRAAGPARDVRVRAWGGGRESSTVIRICCRSAAFPLHRVYLPLALHTRSAQSEDTRVFIPVVRR